jgi:hypothetical protein
MTKKLDVLLIEARAGDGAMDADRLEAAGHRVHRCWSAPEPTEGAAPPEETSLCVGVTSGSCPVDDGIDVALLVRRRITRRPTANEAGVSCALRAGIPVVENGPEILDPFEPWLTARVGDDVAASCVEAVERGFEPLRLDIRDRIHGVLVAAGVDPDAVESEVTYLHPRLTVQLSGPAVSTQVQQALGVRVLDAVRSSNRTYGQVDVAYEPTTR